jgi:hypothetical protein
LGIALALNTGIAGTSVSSFPSDLRDLSLSSVLKLKGAASVICLSLRGVMIEAYSNNFLSKGSALNFTGFSLFYRYSPNVLFPS